MEEYLLLFPSCNSMESSEWKRGGAPGDSLWKKP